MKKKFIFSIAAISFIVFAFNFSTSTPAPEDEFPDREALLMEVVIQSLKYNHYKSTPIDNDLSKKVFDSYLLRVDNGKRIFLQSDVDEFKKHRLKLDDYALDHNFDFVVDLNKIKTARINQIKGYYEEILAKPFDFDKKESFETDVEKLKYAQDGSELKLKWHKLLKYRVLVELDSKLKRQEDAEKDQDTSVAIKTFEELESDARAKTLKDFGRWYKNMNQDEKDDHVAFFINSFANVIEPHTSYFPPLEKDNFDIRMSGKLEGIGAQLLPKDGYIKVTRIVPGSASWKQGELAVNDLIMKVAQGDAEPIDIVDMDMDDVLPMIRGKKGTEVRLTVKKEGGTVVTIPIVRDVVVLEESYAKSAVIEGEDGKEKVGLIDLRSFYADFNDANGRRSSVDMKKEVEKLIAEDVDGIIIDLRYNGGGSLTDAVDMTGLFIDEGPIVQVKPGKGLPLVLNDEDAGVLYKGPLVILVNSFSASASEIMAAALQDYGRAVIIGSAPSTFGKGTVQRFFSLDRVVPQEYASYGELGSIKITTQKFFRINGGSTQLKGVTPDIVLPGLYSYIPTGEKEEEYPLPWTEIAASDYKKSSVKKMSSIKRNSAARLVENKAFGIIDERAKWVKEQQDETEISLNLKDYRARQDLLLKKSDEYEAVIEEKKDLNISSVSADMKALKSDTVRASSMETWHNALKKDPYLVEAVEVIGDW